jgi:riboflavin synthase
VFTGIIEATGSIKELRKDGSSARFGILTDIHPFDVAIGASVSVDGVCLTLESSGNNVLYFTAVAETLSRTTLGKKRSGDRVNLERALPLSGRIDGHFVLGHVDAVGTIVSDGNSGKSVVRTLRIPEKIKRFCAEKGSVALDGISLTIASISGDEIVVSLVPFTLEKTTFAFKRPGDGVNIECDVLARYIARLLESGAIHQAKNRSNNGSPAGAEGTLFATLERSGF